MENKPCVYCGGYGRYLPNPGEPWNPCPLGHAEVFSQAEWTREYRRQVAVNMGRVRGRLIPVRKPGYGR